MCSGWHILQYVVLLDGMSYGMSYFLEGMYYRGLVLQFKMSYVLLEGMSYTKLCIT